MAPVKSGNDGALCAVAPPAPPMGAGCCAGAGDAATTAATDEITAKMEVRRFEAMCLSLTCGPPVGSTLHRLRMCREGRSVLHATRQLGECEVGVQIDRKSVV